MQLAIEEFCSVDMPSRNLAPRTRVEYRNDIEGLVAFLQQANVYRVGEIRVSNIDGYLAHLEGQGMSGATRKRKAITFRAFLAFLYRHGHISHDISRQVIPPYSEVVVPRILMQGEYQRLLQACAHNPRDTALITLLLQTGIRLSELIRLTMADIEMSENGDSGAVRVAGTGRRKGRIIPLNSKVCQALRVYFQQRTGDPNAALFINRSGKPMGERGVQKRIMRYFRLAQILGASVHSLRHTFGVHHVAKGTSLKNLQEVMGHHDIRTTETYVPLAQEVKRREMEENAL